MSPRECMLNLMADIIGLDDSYTGEKLNDESVWNEFMSAVFSRMDSIEDEKIRKILDHITSEEFQEWIDDPVFWQSIDAEITRRGNLFKTILPSDQAGNC